MRKDLILICEQGGSHFYRGDNILSLTRNDNSATAVDQLSYTYTINNRLEFVYDNIPYTSGADWDAEDGRYFYDGNGNLTCWWEDGKPDRCLVYDRQNQPITIEELDPASPSLVYETSGANGNGWLGMLRYQINDGGWVNKTGRGIWVIELNKETGVELSAYRYDMHNDG